MKNLILLLAVVGLGVALAGCSTTSSQCGRLHANCCSWDWYEKCDLIEGRVDGNCPVVCGEPPCAQGVISTRCYELPAPPPAPAAGQAEEEMELLPEPAVVDGE